MKQHLRSALHSWPLLPFFAGWLALIATGYPDVAATWGIVYTLLLVVCDIASKRRLESTPPRDT